MQILNSEPGDYKDSAMESAQREFRSRNLSAEKIEQIKDTIEKEKVEQEEYEHEIEANAPPKTLTFSWYAFWRWFSSDGSDEG